MMPSSHSSINFMISLVHAHYRIAGNFGEVFNP